MSTKRIIEKRQGVKTLKHTAQELNELDYVHKLSPKEREFLVQFMYEYYQADFSYEKPIHGPQHRKDCEYRNNAEKRQWHSVGSILKQEAAERARQKSWYYTPEDYNSAYDLGSYISDDDEEQ